MSRSPVLPPRILLGFQLWYRHLRKRSWAACARSLALVGITAPVHRLPFELLARVFEFIIVPDRDRMDIWGFAEGITFADCIPFVDLIRVTHVCRLWRDVALASPTLWTGINDRNRTRLDAFRCRSQSAPLSYEICRVNDPYITRLLHDDGLRVRQLNIGCRVWETQDIFLPSSLRFDGSFLEAIRMAPRHISERGPMDVDLLASPGTLFGHAMLPLKALLVETYKGFWLPPPTLELPRLTHLYLIEPFGDADAPAFKLQTITTLLQNAPRLQYLHLECLPAVADTADLLSALHPVSLPHLKRFSCVCDDPNTANRLLSLLLFPQDVTVYILQYVHREDHDPPALWQLPSSAFMENLTRLVLSIAYCGLTMAADGPRSGLLLQAEHKYGPRRAEQSGLQRWFRRVRSLVAVASIQTLDFLVEDGGAVRFLQDVLLHMPSVVALQVRVRQPSLISDALPLLGDPVYCPRLTTLCIETSAQSLDELCPAGITDVLAARARAGTPIRLLALRVRSYATTTWPADAETWPARVREAFSAAAAFVEEMDLALDDVTLGTFAPRWDLWAAPEEAKKYWTAPRRSGIDLRKAETLGPFS